MEGPEHEKKLAEVQEKFGHLLPRETALSVLRSGQPMLAKITRIFQPHAFERNGKKGSVCRVEVEVRGGLSDGMRKTLVLWDADAEKLGGELREGDWLEASGAYEKEGELHVGRGGKISKADAPKGGNSNTIISKRATIKDLRAQADAVHATIDIGGREVKEVARGKRALELLGLRTAHEGISFYTILQLKRHLLIGKSVSAPPEPKKIEKGN
jgi:hypothetical protein